METKTELLPCPHDGSKVEFCDECGGGCHRIIHDGMEIDLLPTNRQGESLDTRRAICAERWNARVYPEEVQAAIERDTTKRPDFIGDAFGVLVGKCPRCNCEVDHVCNKEICENCGQRLDWIEE